MPTFEQKANQSHLFLPSTSIYRNRSRKRGPHDHTHSQKENPHLLWTDHTSKKVAAIIINYYSSEMRVIALSQRTLYNLVFKALITLESNASQLRPHFIYLPSFIPPLTSIQAEKIAFIYL